MAYLSVIKMRPIPPDACIVPKLSAGECRANTCKQRPPMSPISKRYSFPLPLQRRLVDSTFTMGKSAKRRRKNEIGDAAAGTEKATPPLITRLPFELIAEILLYSTSPADILSLSRTCKHFCATLVENPVAAFIWKSVRAETKPPVPDPVKLGFSEPQLANFIYGGGNCIARTPSPFGSSRAHLTL